MEMILQLIRYTQMYSKAVAQVSTYEKVLRFCIHSLNQITDQVEHKWSQGY